MPLLAEDGTCVVDANAFVTQAEFVAWAEDYLPALDVSDDEAVDAAIMRASSWLSSWPRWNGARTCGRNQGLAWPRTGTRDCDGNPVPDDEVPIEVKLATYSSAVVELQSPGALTPTITPGAQVKRNKVDVIEQEFMTPAEQGSSASDNPLNALRPTVAQVKDYLRCLATFPNDLQTPWPVTV